MSRKQISGRLAALVRRIGMSVGLLGALSAGCGAEALPVNCLGDDGCPPGQHCASTGLAKNRCGAVSDAGVDRTVASSDDGAGSVDGRADVLVPTVGCQRDGDCAVVGLPVCAVALHRCVECVSSLHCAEPRPVCDTGVNACVGCTTRSDCPTAAPVCDPATKTCVACTSRTDCSTDRPVCDVATRTCAQCLASTDCGGNAKPVCDPTTRTCVGCLRAGNCAAPVPVCDATTQTCVGCAARTDCGSTTPACDTTSKTCVGCLARTDCTAATPACDTATKTCVGCLARTDCGAAKPACDTGTNTCVGCLASSDCAASTPICDPAAKSCVQCLSSADCPASAPVCDAKVCRPCKADAECVTRSGANPGVCMTHEDGRCALDSETIYVQNSAGCSMIASSAGGLSGTATLPFCFSQLGLDAVTAARRLVVLRGPAALSYWSTATSGTPVTVVGQNSATIAPGALIGIHVTGAQVFIRDVRVAGGASVGIAADGNATLKLQHLTVDGNTGGGILADGAALQVVNSVVSNNGPGTAGAVAWGGILVQNPPTTGPAQLNLVSLTANKPVGLSCSTAIIATGVYSVGNTGGVEILSTCGVVPCPTPTANCGASLP